MPVLSSFISYKPKPKRKPKAPIKVSSPFNLATSPSPLHPYASPSHRVIDINDGGMLNAGPSPSVSEPSPFYRPISTPRVNLNIDREPLIDWFPVNFFGQEPPVPSRGAERSRVGSGTTHRGPAYSLSDAKNIGPSKGSKEDDVEGGKEGGGEDSHSMTSEDVVLADVLDNLQAMDASNFVNKSGPDAQTEPQPFQKKSAPTPIQIPNAAFQSRKAPLMRSSDPSRPTSQVSSPESSAISGTTLARALLANTYALPGESRTRYRSGGSTLTRTDSATLPRGEFSSFVHSPGWRDRASLELSASLSPGSASSPPSIPPIPGNAESVYVPPQTTRPGSDGTGPRDKRRTSTTGSTKSDQSPATAVSASAAAASVGTRERADSSNNALATRRISRISEDSHSQPATPQLAYTQVEEPEAIEGGRPASPPRPSTAPPRSSIDSPRPPSPSHSLTPAPAPVPIPTTPKSPLPHPISPYLEPPAPLIPAKNRRQSARPVSETSSGQETSGTTITSPPSSAKDFDYMYDFYAALPNNPGSPDSQSSTVVAAGAAERTFRLPFSPITEESSSQLSPPTPFRTDSISSKRSLPPGRFFVGTTPSASINGVRVDWNVRTTMDSRSSRRSSVLPSSDRPGTQTSSNSSSHSRTNLSSSSVSSNASQDKTLAHTLHPPTSNVFNRLRSGSAPSPIKVVRDPHDLSAYSITVTPRTGGGGSEDSTPTTAESDTNIQQTFPETPSAFSPGFSPNGIASPGMRASSSVMNDYLSMAVPQTPMSAFLPTSGGGAGSIQPSLAQQLLLTRAATSVRGARHSREASLGRLMRQQGHPYAAAYSSSISSEAEGITTVLGGAVSSSGNNDVTVSGEATGAGAGAGGAVSDIDKTPKPSLQRDDELEEDIIVPRSRARGLQQSTPLLQKEELLEFPNLPAVSITRSESLRDKPLPEKPEPSPGPSPGSVSSPSLLASVLAASSLQEPSAPVLASVSLPQLTPSPPSQTYLPEPEPPTAPPTPHSLSHGSEEAGLAYDDGGASSEGPIPIASSSSNAPSVVASKRSNTSLMDSPRSNSKGLPHVSLAARIPPAPTTTPPVPPTESGLPVFGPGGVTATTVFGHRNGGGGPSISSINFPSGSDTISPRANNNAQVDKFTTAQRPEPTQGSPPSSNQLTLASTSAASSVLSVSQPPLAPRRPDMINPPPPHVQIPPAQTSASSLYSIAYDPAMSPPSYYAVINSDKAAVAEAITPSTSGSYDPNYRFGTATASSSSQQQLRQEQQPYTPPPNIGEFAVGIGIGGGGGGGNGSAADRVLPKGPSVPPSAHRKPRYRPPLPAGPRRPSQQHNNSSSGSMAHMRDRGGSISSVASQLPSSRRAQTTPLLSPRFQTPLPKWRGYTMDAAKWTFTSTQLQAIVSRAIKQSSEASSIRLLKLETLDGEIPEEIERLETVRLDTITKYKALSRRRATLFESLANSVDSVDQDSTAHSMRLIDDLREICIMHDRLAEELHSTNEQLSQLKQLCQSHSASALAMALRKLNSSLLKHFKELQILRQNVEILEAERDEAWKEAGAIANEYEDLRTGRVESPDAENRFDRVMAIRKSSVRATRAGLRSASTRSNHRASTGSSSRALGAVTPSSARTTYMGAVTPSSARTTYMDDIPPIPAIPRRRPVDIKTNLPSRSSMVTGGSTDGLTPTSETRAMVRAQEELYDMLGIDSRGRRSRSVIGVPGESEMTQTATSPLYLPYEGPTNTGRRASLPDSAALAPHPYNALAADVSIILTSDDRGAGWF